MKASVCLYVLIACYCCLCPFTKVEESFNLQAMHDFLHYGTNLAHYDHLEFPGVVPRTCVGAAIVSALAKPLLFVLERVVVAPPLGLLEQVVVRLVLAALVTASLLPWQRALRKMFGPRTDAWFILLTCCQFHFCFWSSRPLPNIFAFPLVTVGLAHWVQSMASTTDRAFHQTRMIDYLSVAGIVFRFEAGILLVILLFYQLVVFRILAFRVALTRLVASSALSLLVTVPIDSWFWRRWVWPEGEGFFFNVVLNKSNEWGTMPFYAYAVLFLPRVLMVAYPLSLLAAWRIPQSRQLLLPAWTYIFVFSLLPHKEWRFLIYVVPVLTGVAAAMMDQLWRDTHHSGFICVLVTRVGLFGCLAASFMVALGMVYISSWNYPGGEALHVLHQTHDASASIRVHMDVGTAMTGASRFGQWYNDGPWSYSKDETHASLDDYLDARYTHLITTVPPNSMPPDFDLVHVTHAFHRVRRRTSLAQWLKDLKQWRWRRFLAPLSVDIGPAIYTMQLRHPHATWLNHTLHKYPLVLYSKSYCPYCHAAKQLLASHCPNLQGIHVIEVDQQPDGAQIKQALIDRTGQRTFPHLFIGGTSYGGYDAMLTMEKDQLLGERLACPR